MENPLQHRVIVCRTFPERKIHSYLEQLLMSWRSAIHLLMYELLSMTTIATPLSAVSTTHVLPSLRVLMDKSSYVDKCMALLQDTNVYQPCRDLTVLSSLRVLISLAKFTDKSRQLFASSRENMGKITIGFSYNTINCSPQVIPVHQQDFMVYQKYIRQIAQCIL